eukprot:CAMPEP_0118646358 /NCGR_PEP_ID=MMETSP0785-20121206/8010_1 /TAXON_ID=91992 /ORGANISM="Bolidomonas pacifica, Strain CCMP 1866" /LENGTH=383 /DNA_ID=CAMNT_0006538339 /DNA_START=168 /DNA_END=1319 /DNA_ORIENTATION=+
MKFSAVTILGLATAASASTSVEASTSVSKEFKSWMDEHSKRYASSSALFAAHKVFSANLKIIEELNADEGDTAEYGTTKFSDMTQAEFKDTMLLPSYSPLPTGSNVNKFKPSVTDIPDSYDYRDEGAVTSVKDQGSLGTCWIFSTVGNLEGQRFLGGQPLVDLSVEHVLECDATHDDTSGDCGVFGGWPYLALQGIIERGGIFSDEDMSYCAGIGYGKDGYCLPCMADDYSVKMCGDHTDDDGGIPLYCEPETTLGQGDAELCKGETSDVKYAYSISNWTDASSSSSDDISAALVEIGPLSVALDATKLQFYKGGVFNPSKCSTTPNHAVLMVGYGTDDTDGDYFIIKNSWADKWGEDGYFRIAKQDGDGTCAINNYVVSGLE